MLGILGGDVVHSVVGVVIIQQHLLGGILDVYGRDPHQRIVVIHLGAAARQGDAFRPVPAVGVDGDKTRSRQRHAGQLVVGVVCVAVSGTVRRAEGFLQPVGVVIVAVGQGKRSVIDSFGDFAMGVVKRVKGGGAAVVVTSEIAGPVVGKADRLGSGVGIGRSIMVGFHQPPGIVIEVGRFLVFSIDLLDQVAGRVIPVTGFLPSGPDLSDQPVIAVVFEVGNAAVGVDQFDQIVLCVVNVIWPSALAIPSYSSFLWTLRVHRHGDIKHETNATITGVNYTGCG